MIIPLLPDVTARATDFEDRFYGFEESTSTGWYRPWNGELSVSSEKAYAGSKSLKITGRQNSWDSPALNMYNIIKQGGAGVYTIHMAVLVDDLVDGGEYGHLLIRGNQENSFITLRSNGNYYYKLTSTVKFVENEWYHFTGSFVVKNNDINASSGLFNLCFDFITPTANQNVYIDNVRVVKMDPLQVIPTAETLYVGDRLILDVNRYNYTTYTSSDSSVATVDSNGVVLAIASGRTTITVNYNNIETAECVVVVKSVEDGQYFIKNVSADNYAQLDNNGDVIVEAWEFDGAQDQRWNITHVGAGYYKITCASGGNALTVADTENANKALEVANYTGVSTQKWRIDEVGNGNYKITPKVAIDSRIDWCMAVGDSATEGITNGRNVEYRKYSEIEQEKGQWILRAINTFYVYHYYDEGFLKRTNNSLELIKECQDTVSENFYALFGLNVVAQYFPYTSKADDCKISSYGKITSANVNYGCAHLFKCINTDKLRSELINDVDEGEILVSKVLWTGHIMEDHSEDRSNSLYSNHTVVITSAMTVTYDQDSNTYTDKSYYEKRKESTFTLMHELSHQLSLPDHYCYSETALGVCVNKNCDKCYNGYAETRECIMGRRYDDVYCNDCINTINDYLDTYF